MRCVIHILLVVAMCAAVLGIRKHRQRINTASAQPMSLAEESTDVAATLRAISASEADAPTKGWATRFVD